MRELKYDWQEMKDKFNRQKEIKNKEVKTRNKKKLFKKLGQIYSLIMEKENETRYRLDISVDKNETDEQFMHSLIQSMRPNNISYQSKNSKFKKKLDDAQPQVQGDAFIIGVNKITTAYKPTSCSREIDEEVDDASINYANGFFYDENVTNYLINSTYLTDRLVKAIKIENYDKANLKAMRSITGYDIKIQ